MISLYIEENKVIKLNFLIDELIMITYYVIYLNIKGFICYSTV